MKKLLGMTLFVAVALSACGQPQSSQNSQTSQTPNSMNGTPSALPAGYLEAQFWKPRPPSPPPGQDIIVFNDLNFFIASGPQPNNPENQKMFRNLVNYTHPGPRGSATEVWVDRGHAVGECGSECQPSDMTTFANVITAAGYTVTFKNTNLGDLATIPSNVKVLMLLMPTVAYNKAEVNAMKQFAADGGRIVFVGEWQGFYNGIVFENAFLQQMGAVMKNVGNAVDCGNVILPAASLRAAQVTTGMSGVAMGCSSVIQPGPQDYIFLFDSTNKLALAGVARIDITPLP